MSENTQGRKFVSKDYYFLGARLVESKKNAGKKFGVVDLVSYAHFDDGTISHKVENPFVSEELVNKILAKGIAPLHKVSIEVEATGLNAMPKLINVTAID